MRYYASYVSRLFADPCPPSTARNLLSARRSILTLLTLPSSCCRDAARARACGLQQRSARPEAGAA